MKFEKFFKMCGVHFCVLKGDWIAYGNMLVKIPAALRMQFTEHPATMPAFAVGVLGDHENEVDSVATVSEARLPSPEASAKDIRRVFKTVSGMEIEIPNSIFSLIESSDKTSISYDEEGAKALVVTSGFGDAEEVTMIVFDEGYFEEVR